MYQGTNNNVELVGTIVSNPIFDHEIYHEKFYKFNLETNRTSGNTDIIPVLVSQYTFDISEIKIGARINISGQFRSYNLHEENKNKLVLNVFAVDMIETEFEDDINEINIEGFICKEPIYRKTPLGREIADLLVAVNRAYGKSDYIPVIAWGRNARMSINLQVGDKVSIDGRIQSREYKKKLSDDDIETRVAYEISAKNIIKCETDEIDDNVVA